MSKRFKNLLALFIVVVVSLLGIFGCDKASEKSSGKPPIILVIVDTLRADHVGAYGYLRPTSPNIDRFAAKATRYENAYAAASWTAPSMVSLFTGVYSPKHGIVNDFVKVGGYREHQILHENFTTIAELLRDEGYATMGVSANLHMSPDYGMAQGFETYKVFDFKNRKQVDNWLHNNLHKVRKAAERSQPYFLYVHYLDPHLPYQPVKPFIAKFHSPWPTESSLYMNAVETVKNYQAGYFNTHPERMQDLIDCYDSEIAAVDDSLGALFQKLPKLDEALVILTADHGEAHGDHDNIAHGHDVYWEEARVPLLVKMPGQMKGNVTEKTVSLVDILPSIARLVGAKPPRYVDGENIWSGEEIGPRYLFTSTERKKGKKWASVLGNRYRLLHWKNRDRWEVYDWRIDPKETTDLSKTISKRAISEHRRQLLRFMSRKPLFEVLMTNAGEKHEGISEKLRQLGYI